MKKGIKGKVIFIVGGRFKDPMVKRSYYKIKLKLVILMLAPMISACVQNNKGHSSFDKCYDYNISLTDRISAVYRGCIA